MSYKKATIFVDIVLLFLSAFGIYEATKFPVQSGTNFFGGTQFYPMLLCGAMMVCCFISMFKELKKSDRNIEIVRAKKIMFLVVTAVIWVFLWRTLKVFYPVCLICVAALLWYFNPDPASKKKVLKTIMIDLIIVGSFFVVFDILLNISLV